jgi:hypothetical protein
VRSVTKRARASETTSSKSEALTLKEVADLPPAARKNYIKKLVSEGLDPSRIAPFFNAMAHEAELWRIAKTVHEAVASTGGMRANRTMISALKQIQRAFPAEWAGWVPEKVLLYSLMLCRQGQAEGGRKGKASAAEKRVIERYRSLAAEPMSRRASIIAESLRVSEQQVRRILNRALPEYRKRRNPNIK